MCAEELWQVVDLPINSWRFEISIHDFLTICSEKKNHWSLENAIFLIQGTLLDDFFKIVLVNLTDLFELCVELFN